MRPWLGKEPVAKYSIWLREGTVTVHRSGVDVGILFERISHSQCALGRIMKTRIRDTDFSGSFLFAGYLKALETLRRP